MTISRSRNPATKFYTIDGEILEQVDNTKYLGITISNDLGWSIQAANTSNKANTTLAFLRRNLKLCPKKLKETAYHSLVRSVLEYAATAWDPHLLKDINNLEMVQRRAARFTLNNYTYDSSVTAMLKLLDWQDLRSRREDQRLILFYKIIHGLVMVPVDDSEVLKHADTRTRAAHNFKFKTIRATTNNYKHSFFVATTPAWYNLPTDVAESTTIEMFESRLKNYQA